MGYILVEIFLLLHIHRKRIPLLRDLIIGITFTRRMEGCTYSQQTGIFHQIENESSDCGLSPISDTRKPRWSAKPIKGDDCDSRKRTTNKKMR